DLNQETINKLNINYIPLEFNINDNNYFNYLDQREISHKDFYNLIREKAVGTTSMIGMMRFIEFFEPYLKAGFDILYIAFSSGLSGTYDQARLAKRELLERYSERKINIIDSKAATLGQGQLVIQAIKLQNEGKSLDEVSKEIELLKGKIVHIVAVYDMGVLKRGGRISGTTAALASIMNIKPILHINDEGHLVALKKARGRKQSLRLLIESARERIIEPENKTAFIVHGDDEETANEIAGVLRSEFKFKEVITEYIGPVIGAHSGPNTIGITFIGGFR
ncbi:MAG: DegV family protein, partial [Acholeplasmataceae bacterium]|nr:DegV family protein [Acholeplasmataceae bacterium]